MGNYEAQYKGVEDYLEKLNSMLNGSHYQRGYVTHFVERDFSKFSDDVRWLLEHSKEFDKSMTKHA